ncbi:Permease of the drug/metabolite transporter (DMT) superfamily [Andreprevotia lacus DSM 23236]|jgi:drug/metabolite transporter (DMT)-like permease|uniref:Permease of the drug/metabolite transporter (DMT) superfamily n=1 Tax=Andreprevotia lacus DSM 23236 TaxID=1121001 RepID=A0A1W1XVT0_9NEIS|nr:drug/metabolite exporter YedA [Andreprevotia lacus]SMC28069.1 Permease of the drug/metabolite transporter (DMT) superfamily [Andreprevotia lacus DSM 23236]
MLRSRLLLGLATIYLVWGSTYLGIRIAVAEIPPLTMAAFRFLVAGGGMLLWLRWRGTPWPSWRQVRSAVAIGSLMLVVGNGGVSVAEVAVPSGLTALLLAVAPLFAVLFAWAFGSPPHRAEWLGVGLGLVGVALLQQDTRLAGSPWAFGLILAASLSWSFAAVWQKKLDMPSGAMSAAVQMSSAGVILLLLGRLRGEPWPHDVHWHSWAALAYLIVFGSLVAYNAFVYVLAHARPALASSYAYVNPPVAVLLGWLLAGEHLSWPMLAGMGVVLAGVILLAVAHRR